ncbi:hypothetical protein [Streptosporangium sp. CA-115845]|uniref:hypothetical protein n=1 Tax=Streptosporangium sp. CA-115845 TaxID=3240071 RepID=UPI003D8A4ABC
MGRPRLRDASEITHAAAWGLLLLARLESHPPVDEEETEDQQAALRGLIRALDQRILPRLEGLRDAAVRQHRDLEGSHGQLAEAMGVARSTASTRVAALAEREISDGERWARGLDRQPTDPPARPHTVTFDLDEDEHAYFVLTEALREFAARQRQEADHDDVASDPHGSGHRREWVKTAGRLLTGIDTALG